MRRHIAAIAMGTALIAAAAHAEGAPPAVGPVPGWTEFLDGLRDLPARILARLPEAERNDPQVRQEVGRLALSAVAQASIGALANDPDHPVFVLATNNFITTGQPNADTGYRFARITPGGSYRLRGRRGALIVMKLAETSPRPEPGAAAPASPTGPWPVHDFNTLHLDAQGRYDVILSPTRPAGYTGDWWPLNPTSNSLLLRTVNADWGREIEPTFSIERLDAPATRPRPPAAMLEAALRGVPAAASFGALVLIDRPEKLRAAGYVNKLRGVDMAGIGGLAGQFYYEGAYHLKDDEALIVEAPLPAQCVYRSIILTNDIYETTDWYNNQSSLNMTQAPADRDGVLRIVVSARDPGVPNWLDTAGYRTGVIQGRWNECSSQPVPTVTKVPLAEVRRHLPAETDTVTPQQREQALRDRRATLQQRPLW